MPTVSKPSFRARTWESHGAAKSAWEVSFFVIDGQKRRRVLRSGFATRRAAEAAFRDYSKEVMDGEFDKEPVVAAPTLREFTERYLVEGTAGKRPRSIEIDRLAFHWFMHYVPGDTLLDEVAPHQIDAYVARRLHDKPRMIAASNTLTRERYRSPKFLLSRISTERVSSETHHKKMRQRKAPRVAPNSRPADAVTPDDDAIESYSLAVLRSADIVLA